MPPTKPHRPDRAHVRIDRPKELRFWAKHFGKPEGVIIEAVNKVGNAIPTVRKELGLPETERSQT
jgi:hypothetical protein